MTYTEEEYMAKHCSKCGMQVRPEARFCPKCGAKLDPNSTIEIREDGKGGLIMEVPEGSTVTISNEMPKH